MKERPLILAGPNVCATLAGRKTHTRRLVKWPLRSQSDGAKVRRYMPSDVDEINEILSKRPTRETHPHHRGLCPYGVPGQRLWVREAWRLSGWDWEDSDQCIAYKADGATIWQTFEAYGDGDESATDWLMREVDKLCALTGVKWRNRLDPEAPLKDRAEDEDDYAVFDGVNRPWKSPIFMPRWASRLTLEIVSERIERLGDISEADAIAEGVPDEDIDTVNHNRWLFKDLLEDPSRPAGFAYSFLWESIHGRGSWARDKDQLVWAIEYKMVKPEPASPVGR